MIWTIVQILLPVFALIVMGILLRLKGFLDVPMEQAFNKFAYFIALPSFIFLKTAQSSTIDGEAIEMAGAFILVTLGLLLSSQLFARILRLPRRSIGTFSHAAFRGNLAYIGLPVIAFAVKDLSPTLQEETVRLAVLTIAPGVFVYNILGVMVLEWDRRHEKSGHPFRSFIQSILRNPLILSCGLGFFWNALALPVPTLFIQIASPVSNTAFPLALMAIGARITALSWRKGLLPAVEVSLVKNGVGLLLGLGICHLFGLEGLNRLVVLLLSACPTAVASYVLVDQLDGDRDLAASAIAITTFGSLFALAAALWIGL